MGVGGRIVGLARANPDRAVLAGIAIATAARLVYVTYLGDDLGGPDSNTYHAGGRDVAQRGLLADDVEGLPYFPPGYFFVVGLHYWLFGAHPYAVQVTQVAVAALVSWLVYCVARRLGGADDALVVGIGMSASLAWLALPHPLMYEPWLALVTVAVVLLLLQAEGGSPRPVVLAGLLLGVAVALQDKYLTFVAVAAVLTVLVAGRRQAVVLLGCAGLVVALLVGRNAVVHRAPLVLGANHGVNLLIGNGEQADGGLVAPTMPPPDCPEVDAGDLADHASADRALLACAMREMVEHPGRTLALLPSKFLRFWSPFIGPDENRNNWRHEFDPRKALPTSITDSAAFRSADRAAVAAWMAGGLALLFVGAMALFRRVGIPRALVVLAPIVWLNAIHLLTFGDPRFRIPVLPLVWLVQVLGASAALRWARRWGQRRA